MSNPQSDEFPVLSNEDVKLLYRIITLAEASNSPPFRALFAAYDQVLAEYGIEADHDRVYFRFLLRMGEAKTTEEGLFKRFETLLWKHGIQIDFGEDESDYDINEPLQSIERVQDELVPSQESAPAQQLTAQRSRRSSFSSIYDTGAQQAPHEAIAGLARSQSFDEVSSLQTTTQLGNKIGISQSTNHPRKQRVSFSETAQERLLTSEESAEYEPTIEDETNALGDNSHPIELMRGNKTTSKSDEDLSLVSPTSPLQFSERQMTDMAKKLRFHQLAARAIRLFRLWRDSAQQSHAYHGRMDDMAHQFHVDCVQERGIDFIRSGIEKARRRRDTDKFYDQLENRASRARDLFLLTKAFTHWAQSASDEVLRTSAARRHILRTRYFNAWRDITVVNELKVRRQKFKKFFAIWRQRTYQITALRDESTHFRRSSLIDTYYQHWFWNYCAIRAPGWYEQKAAKKLFGKWLGLAKSALMKKQLSLDFERLLALRRGYTKWIVHSDVVQHNIVEADLFRRRTLLAPSVESMRKEVELSPARNLVKRSVDSRIARAILREWASKARMSLQAAAINDLRIMRNMWTVWNDRLRCLALSRTIDDRVVLESLYKWVINARFALFQRLRDERMKRNFLNMWSSMTKDLGQSLGLAKQSYEASRNARLASSILGTWSIKTLSSSKMERLAKEHQMGHLRQTFVQRWKDRFNTLTPLETWAKDARFYILVSSSLKRWRERTNAAKKSKRREGFSYMRRKVKIAAIKKFFTRWRETTASIQEGSARAQGTYQQKLLSVASGYFDKWHEQVLIITSMYHTAEEVSRDVMIQTTLRKLVEQMNNHQTLDREAEEFFTDIVESAAIRSLRRLNWQVFQNQSRRLQETAQSLSDRNARKHYRSMLRYWAEKAATKRQMPSPTDEKRLPSPELDDEDENERSRFGQSIRRVLFDNVVDRNSVPATPAYLATPSRRTGRVRNRLPAPTTPATMQVTPFLSRLRGHQSALEVRSARADFTRRHGDGPGDGVQDIPESSPTRGD